MKDINMKPDFISFYQSEWKCESQFIHCKDGRVFEQMHRNRYRLIYCALVIILFIWSILFVIILNVEVPRIVVFLPQLFLLLLISLLPIVTYKISRYKLIEDKELIKACETNEEDNEEG